MIEALSCSKTNRRFKIWIRIASVLPLAVLGFAWAISPTIRDLLGQGITLLQQGDIDGLRAWGQQMGWWAPLFTGSLMLVQALAAPIPAILVTATNSFLFGPFWGGIYSIVTANFAAAVCYGLGRGYGTLISDALIPQRTIQTYEDFFELHGGKTILIARLLPFVPFDPISYVAGIARIPFGRFFVATFIGQFPAGMAYSYLAQQVNEPKMFVVYGISALVALGLLGWWAQRTLIRQESLGAEKSGVVESDHRS